MKRLALFALCCAALLLTGCGGTELETQVLVISMGVDMEESGAVTLSMKVPSITGSGASKEDQPGGKEDYLLLSGRGADWHNALETLKATTPRSLNYSQVREIVLSESLARSTRFRELLESVYTLPRMRAMAVVVVCSGKAEEFLDKQKNYIGKRLSKYLDATLRHYATQGFVPETTLSETVRDLSYGYHDPLLLYGALNDFKQETPPKGEPMDQLAGALARKSVNPIDLTGAAVTDGSRVRGLLTGHEMELVNLLRGSLREMSFLTETGYVTLRPDGGGSLSVRDEALHIQVSVAASRTSEGMTDADGVRRLLESELVTLVRKLQSMDSDALGFADHVIRRFSTVAQWEEYGWKQRYPTLDVTVEASVRMVQTR